VPRLLVLLLAGLFAVVAVTDPVACPDHCADGASQHGPASEQPSACVVCHGWSGPAAAPAWGPVFSPVAILLVCRAFTHDAHLPAVYHPPKLA
jgi:hypothetical protein